MSDDPLICPGCGQLTGIKEYDAQLWELHYRRIDGRQNIEPLVYTQEEVEDDPDWYDDRENSGPWLAMGRSMHERGLCTTCARPNLQGMQESDFHSVEDIKELQEMWAEQAAERRAGC